MMERYKSTTFYMFFTIETRDRTFSLKHLEKICCPTFSFSESNLKAMGCGSNQQNVAVAVFIALACCVIGNILPTCLEDNCIYLL